MASTKLYLDKRNKGASLYPVVVNVSANNKSILIPTGLRLAADEWSGEAVIKRPDKTRLNTSLRSFRASVDNTLLSLQMSCRLRGMSSKEIKAEILRALNPGTYKEAGPLLLPVFERFIETKDGRTRELYSNTLSKVETFTSLERLTFADVTPAWLDDFACHLRSQGNKTNTIAIELRNLRAVFNYARKQGITKDYPFINYRIERERTRHRNNRAELLCVLRNWPVEPHQRKYRDIYLLIFYLLGINIIDLCAARACDIVDGRLEYRRAKTKKLYSVWIAPEAWEIIDRYRGKDHLLDVMDGRASYKSFAKALNQNLKRIGWVRIEGRGGKKVRTPILPENTTYWARHSWATIAHKIGISKDVISMALGHSFGADVTDTYIDYDRDLVDDANRKVIAHLTEVEQTEEYRAILDDLAALSAIM